MAIEAKRERGCSLSFALHGMQPCEGHRGWDRRSLAGTDTGTHSTLDGKAARIPSRMRQHSRRRVHRKVPLVPVVEGTLGRGIQSRAPRCRGNSANAEGLKCGGDYRNGTLLSLRLPCIAEHQPYTRGSKPTEVMRGAAAEWTNQKKLVRCLYLITVCRSPWGGSCFKIDHCRALVMPTSVAPVLRLTQPGQRR